MKKYLKDNKPRFTIWLIVLFFISSLLTVYSYRFGSFLLLYPSNITEPAQWYRFITYPFYIDGILFWFFNAVAWVLTAYLFENKISRKSIVLITLLSVVIGGVFYALLNQDQPLLPLGSPVMITWGYITVALVYGWKCRKTLNSIEKAIVILSSLALLSLFLPSNREFILPQLFVVVSIGIFSLGLNIFKKE